MVQDSSEWAGLRSLADRRVSSEAEALPCSSGPGQDGRTPGGGRGRVDTAGPTAPLPPVQTPDVREDAVHPVCCLQLFEELMGREQQVAGG